MHIERLRMALITSYKNNNTFKQYVTPHKNKFSTKEENRLRTLGALLQFIYSLDATKRHIVQDIDIRIEKNAIYFHFYCDLDYKPEQLQTERQKKHLEKELKHPIHLVFTRQ